MNIKELKQQIAEKQEGLKSLKGLKGMENPAKVIEGEIQQLESKLAFMEGEEVRAAERSARKSVDWDKHESPMIRHAWSETAKVGKSSVSMGKGNNANLIAKSIDAGIAPNILLQGPTGTGKTTLMKMVGHELNRPVISINFSGNMEESDVLGNVALNDKGTYFQEGPLVVAMRTGAIFVAEEMNFAKPAVTGKFNSLLDDLRQLDLPNGEIVKAHDDFVFVGTINPDYAGTRELNIAFMNRFNQVYNIDSMSEPLMANIIKAKTGCSDDILIEGLIGLFTMVRKVIVREDYDAAISVRQLINTVSMIERFGAPITSALTICVKAQVSNGDEDLDRFLDKVIPCTQRYVTGRKGGEVKSAKTVLKYFGSTKDKPEAKKEQEDE